MSYNIILYCKSFSRDFPRLKRLHESIQKYNKDSIPFFISTPSSEKDLPPIYLTKKEFNNLKKLIKEYSN